jgi:hypothetical protein
MRRFVFVALLGAVSRFAIAQSADVPLNNWTVPPYRGTASTDGALTTMTDVTPGIGFVGVAPCRLVDTRQAGFPAGYGAPALSPGVPRNFDLNSDPQCPGIPAGVDSYSLNVTVTLTAGPGHLVIYPQGGVQPTVSSINYVAGQTIANAVIVPAGTNGGVTVVAGVSATHLIVDINGYFADTLGSNQFEVRSSGGVAIFGENTGSGYGVWGTSASGFGVVAGGGAGGVWATTDGAGSGVYGQHTGSGYGVYGKSTSGFGVRGLTESGLDSAGVYGVATAASEQIYGVFGEVVSTAVGSAGVYGKAAHGFGVYGRGGSDGVRGVGNTYGVRGLVTSGFNEGYLAAFGYGVYAAGGFAGTGAKYFVEPHPKRPDLVIRYISLEGNEAGTYFRGRGKFQNGLATIDVPEDFRLVTDPENLSVVATPIGAMATVSVLRVGLDRILLRGSRDVEFFYIVNGVRRTHKDLTSIGPGQEFLPESSRATIPAYLTEGQKQMLISNGTYNADGTVNMETARRLGWDKEWEKRNLPVAYPTSE